MKLSGRRCMHCLLSIACLLWVMTPAFADNMINAPRVIHELKHDVSAPLSEMALKVGPAQGPLFEKPERRPAAGFFHQAPGIDAVVQEEYLPNISTTKLLNFDGTNSRQAGGVDPPDTNGSVGTRQFVEITNFAYEVFDKTNGHILLAPTPINTIWHGFGGLCETNNGGDPVALWDKLAERWFVSQLSYTNKFDTFDLCIAVSKTADATGAYNRYAFSTGRNLPDYPKYAVWPDAYYGTNNGGGGSGAEPCAFDRKAMLAGKKAIMICFSPGPSTFGFLPSDLDGSTQPPSGAPNHYVELGNLTNELNEFDFHVDFSHPKRSTFTGPNAIKVPNYILICNDGGNFACVPQPDPGEKVDSLSGLLMFRLAYRNFRDHESMVVAHAVQPGKGSTATVATRWYELRAAPPGSQFALYQSGTFQHKTDNLWMASVAMDKQGDIAMGMSVDNSAKLDTSVWYTGRVPTDPLGKMETPTLVVKGSAIQVNGGNRWGDYSSMSIDPTDDCTFWFAQEYYNKKNGGSQSSDWTTRLASFKFNGCN
jgi:hypothetical protein